jgi:hypothetical protein
MGVVGGAKTAMRRRPEWERSQLLLLLLLDGRLIAAGQLAVVGGSERVSGGKRDLRRDRRLTRLFIS